MTNDCTQVSPGQHFEIKVKPVPSYCGVVWTGSYVAPGESTYTFTFTMLQLKLQPCLNKGSPSVVERAYIQVSIATISPLSSSLQDATQKI